MAKSAFVKSQKPRVLTLAGAYLPGFRAGGPIRSLRNLYDRLNGEIEFQVLTVDRDLGDSEPYPGVTVGRWQKMRGQRVFYVPPGVKGLGHTWRGLRSTSYDVMYLNSFFSVFTTTWSLVLRALRLIPVVPVILAPRGEFSLGALGLKSGKKQLFLKLFPAQWLLKGVTFQATSADEVVDILRALGPVRIREVPNLPTLPEITKLTRDTDGSLLRVAFIGRVNRMKNLHFALRVLRNVRCPVQFTLVGPLEDKAYWQECQELISDLPEHVTVKVRGGLPPHEVAQVLLSSDVLLHPSLGENFGHVIAEALSYGCVPVISDRTPWQDLDVQQAGFVLPLEEPDQFTEVLNELGQSSVLLQQRRRGALQYAKQRVHNEVAIQLNRDLFLSP